MQLLVIAPPNYKTTPLILPKSDDRDVEFAFKFLVVVFGDVLREAGVGVLSRVKRCQVLVVGSGQIRFDVGVQERLFVWVFLRLFENKIGTDFAQEVSD